MSLVESFGSKDNEQFLSATPLTIIIMLCDSQAVSLLVVCFVWWVQDGVEQHRRLVSCETTGCDQLLQT